MKRILIVILLLSTIFLAGCGNTINYTKESLCYQDCIESRDCEFQFKGYTFEKDRVGFKTCQTKCFSLCYQYLNETIQNELSKVSKRC